METDKDFIKYFNVGNNINFVINESNRCDAIEISGTVEHLIIGDISHREYILRDINVDIKCDKSNNYCEEGGNLGLELCFDLINKNIRFFDCDTNIFQYVSIINPKVIKN